MCRQPHRYDASKAAATSGVSTSLPPGPHRENHRQPRPAHPRFAQIERVPWQRAGSRCKAGSPIIRAASHSASISSQVAGRMPRNDRFAAVNFPQQNTRVSATEVREPESADNVRIRSNGHFENSRILRTGPSQAMPRPGRKSSPRRSSSAQGTSPISASPLPNAAAHCAGRSNRKSKRPCSEPCKKPQTSGQVLT
jgi:hypothetical protein